MADKGKLLIADDEELLLEALYDDLAPIADVCLTAGNGRDALDLIIKEKPDAVLSDINMPGMNGLALLQGVRDAGLETPFVFLTAFADKEKVIQALRLGALDFLEKPYDRSILRSTVGEALQLGLELRTLEEELDLLFKDPSLDPGTRDQLREMKRALLINSKRNRVMFKKVG